MKLGASIALGLLLALAAVGAAEVGRMVTRSAQPSCPYDPGCWEMAEDAR